MEKEKDYKIIVLLTEKQHEIITSYIKTSGLTKKNLVEISIVRFIEMPYINSLALTDIRANKNDEKKTKSLNIDMSENHHQMILQYIERTKDDSKSRVKKIAIGKVVISALLNYISINSEIHEVDRIIDVEEKYRVHMMKIEYLKKEYAKYKYQSSTNNRDTSLSEHEYVKGQLGLNDEETKQIMGLFQNTVKVIKEKFIQGSVSLDVVKMVSGLSRDNQISILREIEAQKSKITDTSIKKAIRDLDICIDDDNKLQKKLCFICNIFQDEEQIVSINGKKICLDCAKRISRLI